MSESTRGVIVEHMGQEHTLAEWSNITGISYNSLRVRYLKGYRSERLFATVNKTNCKVCGKEFIAKSFIKKCCSPECKKINAKINGDKWLEKKKVEKAMKPKKKKEKKLTVAEIAVKARELGMSYGQYTAMLYMQERKV